MFRVNDVYNTILSSFGHTVNNSQSQSQSQSQSRRMKIVVIYILSLRKSGKNPCQGSIFAVTKFDRTHYTVYMYV